MENENVKYIDLTDESPDERIEKLLNRFGQTISDLPQSYNGWDYGYSYDARKLAKETSYKWGASANKVDHQADYICHLSDVINRMEAALETATRWASCDLCVHVKECDTWDQLRNCERYRLRDIYLEG